MAALLVPQIGSEGCDDRGLADRFCFSPKKSGPDHAVPVIFLAIADSELHRVPCHEKPSSRTTTSYGDAAQGQPLPRRLPSLCLLHRCKHRVCTTAQSRHIKPTDERRPSPEEYGKCKENRHNPGKGQGVPKW